MSDMGKEYAQHFTRGAKVTVCVPMDNNEIFRERSVVESLDDELLTLSLARERYFGVAHLIQGATLDLRISVNGGRYRCNGVLVRVEPSGVIGVVLTGSVTAAEPREYFRINTFIPYRYEFPAEQSLDALIEKWRTKRHLMRERSVARRAALVESQSRFSGTALDESDPLVGRPLSAFRQEATAFSDVDESWNRVNACAVNLSAGGFKFATTDEFAIDELVFIELFIPVQPPRIVVTLARVVYKTDHEDIKEEKKYCNIAVHFVLIDAGDMETLVSHIFKVESQQTPRKAQLPVSETKIQNARMNNLVVTLLIILLASLILFLYYYISNHDVRDHIEGMFGNAVKQYRSE